MEVPVSADGERRESRRSSDRTAVWIERALLFAVTTVFSLLVWIFEGVPEQLERNEKATALLVYQTQRLTEEVKELNDLRGRQLALQKDVDLLDRRVTKLEDRRFSAFPQSPGGHR